METETRADAHPNTEMTNALVTVGEGRGFVVQGAHEQLVITAAHCLPHLPPCASISLERERTYPDLLAPLGDNPIVWAECLFVDPIADIAVLGPPDNQVFYDEERAYEQLVDSAAVLAVGDTYGWPEEVNPAFRHHEGDSVFRDIEGIDPPTVRTTSGLLLSLNGHWFGCRLTIYKGFFGDSSIMVEDADESLTPGMSGSPIVVNEAAVGVFVASGGRNDEAHNAGGPQPRLDDDLPPRFVFA